jgi:cytochrome b involved in lipid metabolism
MASPSVTVLPRWKIGPFPITGGRSDYKLTEYIHRHPGGTAVALYDAGEGAGERNGQRGMSKEMRVAGIATWRTPIDRCAGGVLIIDFTCLE